MTVQVNNNNETDDDEGEHNWCFLFIKLLQTDNRIQKYFSNECVNFIHSVELLPSMLWLCMRFYNFLLLIFLSFFVFVDLLIKKNEESANSRVLIDDLESTSVLIEFNRPAIGRYANLNDTTEYAPRMTQHNV